MRLYLILFLAFLLFDKTAIAQKFVQLERAHSPKTTKYYAGDEITFQLVGGQWYTRVIEDVSYEENSILFAKGFVSVDSIIAWKSFKNRRWSRPLGNQLFNFAIAWVLFSVIDQAVSDDPFQDIPKSSYIIPAASVATGIGIKQIFKQRTYRLTKNKAGEAKKWRLRVLDLNLK
ncbi:MAG: hypothetical protein H6577_07935 [Lewinellaceae bacterium]|nr:hypothetical protein [Saprospiraceae bacterium]MCB9338044.1 hypothetical protein [Lewinellaceae bacterium]